MNQGDTTAVGLGIERPTHVRYQVVGMGVALAGITYMDRVCISTLSDHIMGDLSLTKDQMSYVFSAFALAYALFEVPTAWWADRMGTRRVLARIVLWWSSFTIATAGAFGFLSLVITRFLFGAGEAGAWPSVARTFSRWIPRNERGKVQGIFFAGAHLAGGLTPSLVGVLLLLVPWRMIFVLFGLLGFVWVAVWYAWFRDDPSEHPAVNAAELEKIVANREVDSGHTAHWDYWKTLFSHRNTFALCVMYFPNSYAFYFCITWLPTYLKEQQELDKVWLYILAGLPLVLSVLGDLFGGVTTDYVTARFGLRAGRSGVGAVAYLIAGMSMILAPLCGNAFLAAILISVAVAASMFTLAAAWGTCLDVAGAHAGVVSAVMNTSGQISSILSPIVAIRLNHAYGSWDPTLYLMGGLFLIGAVGWCLVDPRRRIFS